MTSTSPNAILGQFSLANEIERFPPDRPSPRAPSGHGAPAPGAAGRRAETLVKSDGLRVVLITMRAGATLHEHMAPGPITIQAVRGRFTVSLGSEARELDSGDLIAIAAGARHAVQAVADGAFLLTIGWTPGTAATKTDDQPPFEH